MPETTANTPWLALAVKQRYERAVAESRRARGLDEFLPMYRVRHRWSDRMKSVDQVLFPGYLFCRFQPEARISVMTTPSVISVVCIGKAPAAVDDVELAAIRRVVESGSPVQPWPYLQAGQEVRIESGPLGGLRGTLVGQKDFSRVVVSINLLQRSVAVEIGRELLSAVNRPESPTLPAVRAMSVGCGG